MHELAPYFNLLSSFNNTNAVAIDLAHNVFLVGAVLARKPENVLELGIGSGYVTNSLLHGGSSVPGEAVTVTVVIWDAGVRVEVTGRKADGVPVLRGPDDDAEGSRGLRLVE